MRKSRGCHDVSGDYNSYHQIERQTMATGFVELKGNDGKYTLANCVENGYSYAVSTTACNKETMQRLLEQIK